MAQIFTILFSLPLWQRRSEFPNVPLVPLANHIDYAILLLVAAVSALLFPRAGSAVFALIGITSMLADQMRLQPEFISLMAFMLLACLRSHGLTLARFLLASMWIWAGIHKVLSPGWWQFGGSFIAGTLHMPAMSGAIGVAVPVVEMSMGIAAIITTLNVIARFGGPLLHIGILVTLIAASQNTSVMPWNAALSVIAFLTLAPAEWKLPLRLRIALMPLFVYPALFYFGVVDAYLSYNLFSYNTEIAEQCRSGNPKSCTNLNEFALRELNVPIPPQKRIFRSVFNGTCKQEDTLRLASRHTYFNSLRVSESHCRRF